MPNGTRSASHRLDEPAPYSPGDPRERDNFCLILAHFISHGVHWALRASSSIREAKVCSLGLKPRVSSELERLALLASALNSGANPVFGPFDMLDSLRHGQGQSVEPCIIFAAPRARFQRVLSSLEGGARELAHSANLYAELV
jgi:hypothetical protein